MWTHVLSIFSGMTMLLSVSCGGVSELPAVPQPWAQASGGRGYTVLVQETYERETVFVVAVPNAAETDQGVLLSIAKELHLTRGERNRTAVIFQAPGKAPGPRLPLESQYTRAFAVGIVDSDKGIHTVQFGTFN
jgi:hypothetical protein